MLEIPGIVDLERTISRRRFLQYSAYGSVASLLNQSGLRANPSLAPRPIRSCIVLMLYGGPSQLDTWDMKPNATVEIRGEYQPISTSVPGRIVCEHLPRLAKFVDRLAVVRSMHHGMSNHNSAMYQALVGRRPKIDLDVLGADRASDFPSLASSLNYLTSAGSLPRTSNPLTSVALPHVMHNVVDLPGQNAGFLGGRMIHCRSPMTRIFWTFRCPISACLRVSTSSGCRSDCRYCDRCKQTLAEAAKSRCSHIINEPFDLLRSDAIQRAFRIDREHEKVRDRYGRNTLGQSLLLARKLVEADVRYINVNDKVYNGQDANWDSHANIFPRHRELLGPFDQGFSALIEDLEQSGLLETTLVIVMGEFGRTPRVNTSGGRDHWPDCYSVVVAGGGVAAGSTYGESDRHGAYPIADAVTPGDLAATVLWRFGIDSRQEINDPLGRPLPLAEGSPIKKLFPGPA